MEQEIENKAKKAAYLKFMIVKNQTISHKASDKPLGKAYKEGFEEGYYTALKDLQKLN